MYKGSVTLELFMSVFAFLYELFTCKWSDLITLSNGYCYQGSKCNAHGTQHSAICVKSWESHKHWQKYQIILKKYRDYHIVYRISLCLHWFILFINKALQLYRSSRDKIKTEISQTKIDVTIFIWEVFQLHAIHEESCKFVKKYKNWQKKYKCDEVFNVHQGIMHCTAFSLPTCEGNTIDKSVLLFCLPVTKKDLYAVYPQ